MYYEERYIELCTLDKHSYYSCRLYTLNVSTERLTWRLMLRQMREKTLRQILHVRVVSKLQKSLFSDLSKWRCALCR